jgi:hypothetical protein
MSRMAATDRSSEHDDQHTSGMLILTSELDSANAMIVAAKTSTDAQSRRAMVAGVLKAEKMTELAAVLDYTDKPLGTAIEQLPGLILYYLGD